MKVSRVLEGVQSSGQFDGAREDSQRRKAVQMPGLRPAILAEQLRDDTHADALWRTSLQVGDNGIIA